MVLGVGYGLCFNCLFRFIQSLIKRTRLFLGLSCAEDGDTHSESFDSPRTSSRNKRSTSYLNIFSCTFGTRYGLGHIRFLFYFHSKSNGYFFQVPSVPLNNSSNTFNNLSNSLRCSSFKLYHLFFITLFKSDFSYL